MGCAPRCSPTSDVTLGSSADQPSARVRPPSRSPGRPEHGPRLAGRARMFYCQRPRRGRSAPHRCHTGWDGLAWCRGCTPSRTHPSPPSNGIGPFGRLVEQGMTSLDRPARGRPREPVPDTPPGPRLVAQPGRALLLDRPAQGAHPKRLRLPGGARRAPARLRPPLPRDRPPVRVDVHPLRPRAGARASRRPGGAGRARPGSRLAA
jgi:hypothetical protein